LGLARSGQAVAELLAAAGCKVFVSDSARSPEIEASAKQLFGLGIKAEIGGHTNRALHGDLLVRSPGVPADNPILVEARNRGLAVVSEIEVAFWFCRAQVAAVTGSNGKTTTAEWLGDLLRRAGKTAAVCGNVGRPFSSATMILEGDDIGVVEMSSFQLEDVIRFSPRLAIMTNFSPDHLDRHVSYEAYIETKCRIFERQGKDDALIFNRGDGELSRRTASAPGRRLSFGLDEPSAIGTGLRGEDVVVFDGDHMRVLIQRRDLALPGRHNLENALAVACAGFDLGVQDDRIAQALREFSGVPHRLETVLEAGGILWVNDSKATNIASGLVALESFTRPIILLAGGRDKGADFKGVAQRVAGQIKQAILFGEAAPLIEEAWGLHMAVGRVSTLAEAVRQAASLAQEGDVILLSPMCASFDEFKNYEERGDTFKKLVREICQAESAETES
jgi:UDP-N-acetylmuramoylalanine--D-glutamate ligase